MRRQLNNSELNFKIGTDLLHNPPARNSKKNLPNMFNFKNNRMGALKRKRFHVLVKIN